MLTLLIASRTNDGRRSFPREDDGADLSPSNRFRGARKRCKPNDRCRARDCYFLEGADLFYRSRLSSLARCAMPARSSMSDATPLARELRTLGTE